MTHRSAVHKRPVEVAVPRNDVVQTDTSATTGDGFTTMLESVAQEILPRIRDPILSRSGFPGTTSM